MYHPTEISAQSFSRKAMVITMAGDTIYQFVSDKQWKINPPKIRVDDARDLPGKAETFLYPSQVREIRIESGDYYVSAFLHIDKIYSRPFKITEVVSTDSTSKDSVFLRVLVKGKVNLYLYTDENNQDHFYTKSDTMDYTELINKDIPNEYLPSPVISLYKFYNNKIDTSVHYLVHYSDYKNKLITLLKQCPAALEMINNTGYTEKDLIRIISVYNTCFSDGRNSYVSRSGVSTAAFSIMAGISFTQVKFYGNDYLFYLDRSSFPSSSSFIFGGAFKFPLDRNLERWRFLTDIYWWHFDTKSDYYGDFDNEYIVHLKSDYAKLCIGPEFKFPKRRLQPFFNGGVSFSYLFHKDNTVRRIHRASNWSAGTPTDQDLSKNYKPFIFNGGFFATLGIEYKRAAIETRYEYNFGFVNGTGLNANSRCIYLLISYRLTKGY